MDDLQAKYDELLSDFNTYRLRTVNEKDNIIKQANSKLITQLIEVVDNFDRAMEHTVNEKHNNFYVGMNNISVQLNNILSDNGLESIIPDEWDDFDPNMHDAFMTESNDMPPNLIVKVVENGYILNGKILKHAKVIVSN